MTISLHFKLLAMSAVIVYMCHSQGSCPTYWMKFQDLCYFISIQELTWNEAKSDCVKKRGVLVAINNYEKNEFIRKNLEIFHVYSAWTSGNDRYINRKWFWTARRLGPYKNWKYGIDQNRNENDDCLAIESQTGYWVDEDCREEKTYVCQMPIYKKSKSTKKIRRVKKDYSGAFNI